jgi:alpha-galactosidase
MDKGRPGDNLSVQLEQRTLRGFSTSVAFFATARRVAIAAGLLWLAGAAGVSDAAARAFWNWASTPPMGWNSWDCFGAGVTEKTVKANADYMAQHLASHGWRYIVVDIQWYQPTAKGWNYEQNAKLEMDRYGRLMPAVNRFPSAAGGRGFKALADYVHSKGLKFGIHILRGIPRQAVNQNTPILGTKLHAADIFDRIHVCPWNTDMYGVDMSEPGAQEYYDSVFQQYADWGVDFVKVDDLSYPYHAAEIAAIRKAIDRGGRPMVLSTSPGPTPLSDGRDIEMNANMWRISNDFWDRWRLLKEQFQRCADWARFCGTGHYPDADMLPLGAIRATEHGQSRFTPAEQRTVMTLWSISRSPLIFGGNLPQTDPATLALITNDQVLAVDQHSSGGHEIFRHGDEVAWAADAPGGGKYLAVFYLGDPPAAAAYGSPVPVELKDLGFSGACRIEDLWAHRDLGTFTGEFAPVIAFHGAGLYRVSSIKTSQ